MIGNFYGAFYLAEEAGQLSTFCDKISRGYCFEGKVEDPFEWALQLSEIKPVDTLMGNYWAEYESYELVMNKQSKEEEKHLDEATKFIADRHAGMHCEPHKEFAPEGILTKAGIEKYLKGIMLLEPNPANRGGCSLM